MEIEEVLKETLTELLERLSLDYDEITITEEESGNFFVNITSDSPSILIGYHGDNIQALQHLLKILCWKKAPSQEFHIALDIDNYRKRREEKAIQMTEKKIGIVRTTGRPQTMPPMSPYLRRKVHMHCMGAGFEDIETISEGLANERHIIIKSKN